MKLAFAVLWASKLNVGNSYMTYLERGTILSHIEDDEVDDYQQIFQQLLHFRDAFPQGCYWDHAIGFQPFQVTRNEQQTQLSEILSVATTQDDAIPATMPYVLLQAGHRAQVLVTKSLATSCSRCPRFQVLWLYAS